MYKFNHRLFKSELKKQGFTMDTFAQEIRKRGTSSHKQHVFKWVHGTAEPGLNRYLLILDILKKDFMFFITRQKRRKKKG